MCWFPLFDIEVINKLDLYFRYSIVRQGNYFKHSNSFCLKSEYDAKWHLVSFAAKYHFASQNLNPIKWCESKIKNRPTAVT